MFYRIIIPLNCADEPWFKYLLFIGGGIVMVYYMFSNKARTPEKKHIVTPQTEKEKKWGQQTNNHSVTNEEYEDEKPDANIIAQTAKELKTALKKVYVLRKKALIIQRILWLIAGAFLVASAGFYFFSNPGESVFAGYSGFSYKHVLILVPIIAISIISRIYISQLTRYKDSEQKALASMMGKLFPGFKFSQRKSIPREEITKSRIFPWAEQHILQTVFGQVQKETATANINFADIGFVEENLPVKVKRIFMGLPVLNILFVVYQYVIKSFTSKDTADKQVYSFRGLFCKISFNKNIDGTILVLPNNLDQSVNRFFASKFKEEKVLLEDQRFNKEFTVFATDQIEARYMLPTSVMEKIVELKQSFGQDITLSFIDNNMYLSLQKPEGLFSVPEEKINTTDFLQQVVELIYKILNMVDDLRLHNGMSRAQWQEMQEMINDENK